MRFSPIQSAWEMEIEGVKMLLGVWWMEVSTSKMSGSVWICVSWRQPSEARLRSSPWLTLTLRRRLSWRSHTHTQSRGCLTLLRGKMTVQKPVDHKIVKIARVQIQNTINSSKTWSRFGQVLDPFLLRLPTSDLSQLYLRSLSAISPLSISTLWTDGWGWGVRRFGTRALLYKCL